MQYEQRSRIGILCEACTGCAAAGIGDNHENQQYSTDRTGYPLPKGRSGLTSRTATGCMGREMAAGRGRIWGWRIRDTSRGFASIQRIPTWFTRLRWDMFLVRTGSGGFTGPGMGVRRGNRCCFGVKKPEGATWRWIPTIPMFCMPLSGRLTENPGSCRAGDRTAGCLNLPMEVTHGWS